MIIKKPKNIHSHLLEDLEKGEVKILVLADIVTVRHLLFVRKYAMYMYIFAYCTIL